MIFFWRFPHLWPFILPTLGSRKCLMLIAFFEHDLKSSNPSFFSKILPLREVRNFFLNGSIYFWCSLINTHFGWLLHSLSRVWRSKYPSKLFLAKIGSKNYKIKATSFFRLYKWKMRFPRYRLVVRGRNFRLRRRAESPAMDFRARFTS